MCEAVVPVKLEEVCVSHFRALYSGILFWQGVPYQGLSAHHISPHPSLIRCTAHTLLHRDLSVTGPCQLNSIARFGNSALFFHEYLVPLSNVKSWVTEVEIKTPKPYNQDKKQLLRLVYKYLLLLVI